MYISTHGVDPVLIAMSRSHVIVVCSYYFLRRWALCSGNVNCPAFGKHPWSKVTRCSCSFNFALDSFHVLSFRIHVLLFSVHVLSCSFHFAFMSFDVPFVLYSCPFSFLQHVICSSLPSFCMFYLFVIVLSSFWRPVQYRLPSSVFMNMYSSLLYSYGFLGQQCII